MSSTIEDRVILLLKEQMSNADEGSKEQPPLIERLFNGGAISGYGFWVKLGDITGISTARWRRVFERKQRPTTDMLAALGELWPQYAFWIMTGITDVANGHTAPLTTTNFPEQTHAEHSESTRYFKLSMELASDIFHEAKINMLDDKERMYAIERTRPLSHWISGEIVNTAYTLCDSDRYQKLIQLQGEREATRIEHINWLKGINRPWQSPQEATIKKTPIKGVDIRTKHQDQWDWYYKTKNGNQET